MSVQDELSKLKREIRRRGWLLEADATLPSVVTLVAGEPVAGSWWGHPKGNLIYNTICLLEREPDDVCVSLINGKRTHVFRSHWDTLFNLIHLNEGAAQSRLSPGARELLAIVRRRGSVRVDEVSSSTRRADARDQAKELQRWVLCHSSFVHTSAGSHTTLLTSWEAFARERGFAYHPMDAPEVARAVEEFKGEFADAVHLPWEPRSRRAGRQ